MKITPYLTLSNETLEINGFTNLGKFTPEHQRNAVGDHGLVLLYQPFQGSWTQPLAAFLSKGAAPGHVLAQLILEATVLLENSGFFVDGVISDGAQWNRSMWRQFGCDIDTPSCAHPCDPDEDRRLFFLSDFPHLVKNFRNWIIKIKSFQVSLFSSKNIFLVILQECYDVCECVFNADFYLYIKICFSSPAVPPHRNFSSIVEVPFCM